MKKILMYIIGVSFLATTLYNCKKENKLPYHRGVNFFITSKNTYPLNSSVKGNISLSDENISKVGVYVAGQKITDISLSGGQGSYDIPKGDLSLSQVGDETAVKLSADIDGVTASKNYTFKMVNPLAVDGADFMAPIDTTFYIKYQLANNCDDPSSTGFWIKKAVNSGNFDTSVAPVSGGFRNDSIEVTVSPAMANDTLKFKFHYENANGQYETTHELVVQPERAFDFEKYASWTTDFAPWTLNDVDQLPVYGVSSFDYPGEGDPGSWRIFDYADASANGAPTAWEAHSGDKYAFCIAAVPSGGVYNDDWMISPDFDIEAGFSLDMYAKSITDAYGLERMIVKVVDNATGDVVELTNSPYQEVPTDWTNYNWPLDQWAGKNVHIEIGCVSQDAFALMVDDFVIQTPTSSTPIYYNSFENTKNSDFRPKKVK